MARPVWTPTDPQRRQAETLAAYGIPEAEIARVLGVSKPTLRKHCGTELDTGATRANSKVADFLFYGICGGKIKPAPKIMYAKGSVEYEKQQQEQGSSYFPAQK